MGRYYSRTGGVMFDTGRHYNWSDSPGEVPHWEWSARRDEENKRLEDERLENERLENARLENARLENARLENASALVTQRVGNVVSSSGNDHRSFGGFASFLYGDD